MRAPTTLLLALLSALALAGAAARPGASQSPVAAGDSEPSWRAANEALVEAQRTHLRRVALWGALNLAAGASLALTSRADAPMRRGFGIQTAAWGAINLGIVAWGLTAGAPSPAGGPVEALAAEDGWSHLLLVNLGLNVGYVAVGSTLWFLSHRGVESARAVRGHGMAVVVQGVGLLVLDGLAWMSSSDRLEALRGALVEAAVLPGRAPGAVEIVWSVPWPG